MLSLASGNLYNKIQNHERITKLKKRKPKSQLFLVQLESHFLSEKTGEGKKRSFTIYVMKMFRKKSTLK